jgi:homoserine O-acetyltransferase
VRSATCAGTKASAGRVQRKTVRLAGGGRTFRLQSGEELGELTAVYETYGTLSKTKDNAVLVCHALSGDAHAAGHYGDPENEKPGWWDFFIGPGRPLDTDRYFVVSSNFLGSCYGTTGPTSIDPEDGEPYGPRFPSVTIADMVNVQKEIVEGLGIEKLLAVIGGSMGGMQVLEWAVAHPGMVRGAIPIATCPSLSTQAIAFNETGRLAITGDPGWHGGNYPSGEGPATGLALARMIGHITYLSEESMNSKFGRRVAAGEGCEEGGPFQVESYLHHQGNRFVSRFDANTYLLLSRTMDRFDLTEGRGSLENAFSGSSCSWLVVSFTSDWLFPPAQSREMVRALRAAGKETAYCNLESRQGHDAFLLEGNGLGEVVSGFLRRLAREAAP